MARKINNIPSVPIVGISNTKNDAILQKLTNITVKNNKVNSVETVDPAIQQLTTTYLQSGLTVASNNSNIITRDDRGNIVYYESGSDNKILVIETVRKQIQKKSFLSTVDTNFEYFNFPVQIIPTSDAIDLQLEDFDFKLPPEPDPFFAKYKPSADLILPGDSTLATGILLDVVVAGLPQINVNSYTVTQAADDSGKKLRIRANIKHSFTGEDVVVEQDNPFTSGNESLRNSATAGNVGYVYFFIARSGGGFSLDREFAGPFANDTAPNFGKITRGQTLDVYIDFEIDNNDFNIGTTFSITAKTAQPSAHVIIANGTYLSVTEGGKNVDENNKTV